MTTFVQSFCLISFLYSMRLIFIVAFLLKVYNITFVIGDSRPSHLIVTISSLEETYEALKTFEVLGIEKKPDIRTSACASVVDTLRSTSSALKDLFHALRVTSILKCELNDEAFGVLKILFPLSA